MAPLSISAISSHTINETLSRYAATVPNKLTDLDAQRYEHIPTALANRKKSGNPFLKKDEVEKLVEWKLYVLHLPSGSRITNIPIHACSIDIDNSRPRKHGTFRPKLLQLVQSNPSSLIEFTTAQAFAQLSQGPLVSLKTLVKLKGIGPATASLLLSVYAPGDVPFFSDELFRWCLWDEAAAGGKARGGWNREVKYTVREYEALVGKVGGLKERLGDGVRAVDLEKVAWVLGRESVDVGEGDGGEELGKAGNGKSKDVDVVGDTENTAEDVVTPNQEKDTKSDKKKGVKRKAADKEPVENVRRSSRRRGGG